MCNQRAEVIEATNIKVTILVPSCTTAGRTTIYINNNK
jgi:hypothetical protein